MVTSPFEQGMAALRSGDADEMAEVFADQLDDTRPALRTGFLVTFLREVEWSNPRHLRAVLPSAASLISVPDLPAKHGRKLISAVVATGGPPIGRSRWAARRAWEEIRGRAGRDEDLRTGLERMAHSLCRVGQADTALVVYDELISLRACRLATFGQALDAVARGGDDKRLEARARRYLPAALRFAKAHTEIYVAAARVHARLGEPDLAVGMLREARVRGVRWLPALPKDPIFAPLAADTAFKKVCAAPGPSATAPPPMAGPPEFEYGEGELPSADPAEILREFVAEQDWALAMGREGLIWGRHAERIEPLFTEAPRLLEPGERRRLYFHRMALTHLMIRVDAEEHSLVRDAYDDCLAIPTRGLKSPGDFLRMQGVLFFGYDDRGSLPEPAGEDAEQATLAWRVWKQCDADGSMSEMQANRERFRSLAENPEAVGRVLATVRHLLSAPGFGRTSLHFWGMVLIVLMSGGDARQQLLDDCDRLSAARSNDDEYAQRFRETLDELVELTR